MDLRAIGIFDSGLGGLTVLAELIRILPSESYIYVGDTARVPYGSRSKETIQRYSLEIASYLVQNHIKLLVVACNTASAYALPLLKKKFSIPILGVIEPGVHAFFENSKNTSVAIIGTRATIHSGAYEKSIQKIDPEISIYSKACPLLVPLVEEGWIDGRVTYEVIKQYLQEIIDKNISDIILGCTHYPLLKKAMQYVYPHIRLIDSSRETAKYVKRTLEKSNLLRTSNSHSRIEIHLTDITERVPFLEKLFLEKDGFLIITNQTISLVEKPHIRFPIQVQELPLEELTKSYVKS